MKFSCRIFVICILAFISLLHLSCGAGKQDGAKTKKLGFVAIAAADFWTIARKGAEKADQEIDDVTLDFRIPTDGTAAEQKRVRPERVPALPRQYSRPGSLGGSGLRNSETR